MSRLPTVFDWRSIHPRRKVTFARVYDARDFEDEPFSSSRSVCEVIAASPSDINFAPDGGLNIVDIAGGQHYLPPEMVGETHIVTKPLGKVLDLERIVNPDQPIAEQVFEVYQRVHGREFYCAECGEPIPFEDWEHANLEVCLNEHRTYVREIRTVHAKIPCTGQLRPGWLWFRIAAVAPS